MLAKRQSIVVNFDEPQPPWSPAPDTGVTLRLKRVDRRLGEDLVFDV